MKTTLPKWAMLLIGLTAASAVKVVCNQNRKTDHWESLQAVVNNTSEKFITDTAQRKKWCDCVMQTFKSKYPSGDFFTTQEKFNNECAGIGEGCAHYMREK